MYKKMLPLLVLLFSGKVMAYDFPLEIIEYIDDVKIFAYLKQNDIDEKAKWTPFESQPPLSVNDALLAVQQFIKSNEGFTDVSLTSIELKQIPHHKHYWHYLVKVKYSSKDKQQPHFFIVLMDGKVVSALKQPEAIK